MPEKEITTSHFDRILDAATGGLYSFVMRQPFGHLLEVEDTHFHHDSAVLLPDFEETEGDAKKGERADKVSGLAVLRAVYFHAKNHPGQTLQIFGHTDTSGPKAYNQTLSELRADNVAAALMGDRAGWVAIARKKHKVEDQQQILKWIAKAYGWKCDPGGIDNVNNPKTKAATKEFQKQYNLAFASDGRAEIAEDGSLGDQTWGAFFDVYMDVLEDICDVAADSAAGDGEGEGPDAADAAGAGGSDAGAGEGSMDDVAPADGAAAPGPGRLQPLRDALNFAVPERKTVGCGENWPIDAAGMDGHPSRTNRRVEIVFFEAGEAPLLPCHPSPGKCEKDRCDMYGNMFFNLTPIKVDALPLQPRYRVSLRLGDPDALFLPIKDKTHKDLGVQQRLQAAGYFYAVLEDDGLVGEATNENTEAAWNHFKKVKNLKTDAEAVDRLVKIVRKELLKISSTDMGRLPKPGEFARVLYPGTYCVRPENPGFFGSPQTAPPRPSYHYQNEEEVWRANPGIGLFPVLAKVETKALLGRAGTWEKAGAGVPVHFQLIEPDAIADGTFVAPPPLRTNPVGGTIAATYFNAGWGGPATAATLNLDKSPADYVKAERERNPKAAGDPHVDNAFRTVGGKRDRATVGDDRLQNVLMGGGDPRKGFHDVFDLRNAAVSEHAHAAKAETNASGFAAVLFSPAWTGGDRYKLRAFLDPVNGAASDGILEGAIKAETGTFVTFRMLRISKYMRWDYPAGYVQPVLPGGELDFWNGSGGALEDVDFAGVIAREYAKAWQEVDVEPEAQKPQPISQATWKEMTLFARGKLQARIDAKTLVLNTPVHLPTLLPISGMHATDANPSPGIMNFRTDAEYDAAVATAPAPPGGGAWQSLVSARQASPAGFWSDMGQLFDAMYPEIVNYFTRNGIGGLTLIQAPSMASHYVRRRIPGMPPSPWGNSGWGTLYRGCFLVFAKHAYTGDPAHKPAPIVAWMPYDHHSNAMHECGHVLYGVHQHTHKPPNQAPTQSKNTHDEHDYHDLCIMGYQGKGFEDQCGRCHFNHAGWNIHGMAANGP